MSSNSTSPADIYGGTWASISGGRYMRAAGAWGNGGSNTITINQMPSHNHIIPKHYVYDKTGWSAPINGLSLPQVANPAPSSTPFATVAGLDAVTNTGGGQHFIQPTKMFGRGTELPKEGDALCITFNKFKSVLQMASRKFVHSRLVTFICQPIQRVQQTLTVVHGHLSAILGFCDQVVHGTTKVAKKLIRSQSQKCHGTNTQLIRGGKEMAQLQSVQLDGRTGIVELPRQIRKILGHIMQVVLNRITTFRLTVPVTAGTVQPSLAVM